MTNEEKITVLLKRGTYCTLPALRHDATADVIGVICAQKQIKSMDYKKDKIDPRLCGAVFCIV